MRKRIRSTASHVSVFLLGALVASATWAQAIPGPSPRAVASRYAALDSFAQALSLIANSHVDTVEERKLIYGAIVGMVNELDPHSAFYSPEQYTRLRQDTEGEFGGVGLSLGDGAEGLLYPVIETLVADSPAARAGLREGDGVVEIDGNPTVVKGEQRAAAQAWHSRLRGATGTRLVLTVIRKGWKEPRKMTLLRERISIPSVVSTRFGNVAHIAIRRFREATTRDLLAALNEQLKIPKTLLILDLRGNPGGLLDQGVSVADAFLDEGVIVSVVGRGGRNVETYKAHRTHSFVRVPMVVLIDQNSASASEIVAAALQDHKRALVVGVPSYGKGSVQTFLDLKDGSGLKLTTSRYLTPKGRTLEDQGIDPDILVEGFDAMVVSPKARPGRDKKPPIESGLNKAQNELLAEDLQLRKAYQHLTK